VAFESLKTSCTGMKVERSAQNLYWCADECA